MKFSIIFLSSYISNLFTLAKHPVTAIISIATQTLLICVMLAFTMGMNWFAILLFLIFMGGLMVLFSYITSLASNEKFNISLKSTMISMLLLWGLLFYFSQSFETTHYIHYFNLLKENIFYIYSENIMNPSLIIMLYLLLVLVIIVNVIKLYEAPIRSSV